MPIRRVSGKRRSRVFVIAALVASITLTAHAGALGAVGLCSEPLDISGTVSLRSWLPGWLVDLKENDTIAYALHAATASFLDSGRCLPEASGLQWLKAAFHANDDASLDRAVRGLDLARKRNGAAEPLARFLCPRIGSRVERRQSLTAMGRAAMPCFLTEAGTPW